MRVSSPPTANRRLKPRWSRPSMPPPSASSMSPGASIRGSAPASPSVEESRSPRVVAGTVPHYIGVAGLRGATGFFPRGLTILKGAVPDRAPGLGHMAPTYLCRFPGSPLRRPSRLRTHSCRRRRIVVLDGSMLSYDSKTAKAELREAVLQRRDRLAAPARAAAAETIASRPLPVPVPPGKVVSGFSSIRSEINPVPLLRRFADAGASLALPAITRRGEPLVFRAFHFGQELARGQWGIREPRPDAPEVRPDVVLAPLAVFDRRGNRIGYGAGYYDRTLRALRAMKPIVVIGLAFALQEVDEVPAC